MRPRPPVGRAGYRTQAGGQVRRPVRTGERRVAGPLPPDLGSVPEDRRKSPFTGWTREHWVAVSDRLLDGVRRYGPPGTPPSTFRARNRGTAGETTASKAMRARFSSPPTGSPLRTGARQATWPPATRRDCGRGPIPVARRRGRRSKIAPSRLSRLL